MEKKKQTIKFIIHVLEKENRLDILQQTCFEDGLCHSAPLVSPVGDDGDNISLPHLQTRGRKTDLTGSQLYFNCLMTKNVFVNQRRSINGLLNAFVLFGKLSLPDKIYSWNLITMFIFFTTRGQGSTELQMSIFTRGFQTVQKIILEQYFLAYKNISCFFSSLLKIRGNKIVKASSAFICC